MTRVALTLGLSIVVSLLSGVTMAQTLTWGTGGAGGSGTWNTSNSNWWNGTSNTTWTSGTGRNAVFQGTSGTVSLGANNMTAGDLQFNTPGNVLAFGIAGNQRTLIITSLSGTALGSTTFIGHETAGTSGQVALNVDGDTSFNGIIANNGAGVSSFQKGGSGRLTLAEGFNYTATGNFGIGNGVVRLATTSNLPSNLDLTSSTEAVLELAAGNVSRVFSNFAGNRIRLNNSAASLGFAAIGTDRTVTMTNTNDVTWGVAGDGFVVSTLILATATSTGKLTFTHQNAGTGKGLRFTNTSGTATRTIRADNGTAAIDAEIAMPLMDGSGAGQVGGFTKTGGGVLALSASNSYTGPTSVSAGTLQIGSGGTVGSIGSTSGVSVASGATLAFNRTDSYGGNFTRAISGSGGLLLQGGALTLSAAQTYTGNTVISGGTLALGSGGSFANSSRIVLGDAGSSGAALDLTATPSLSIGAGQTLQGIGTALLGPSTALTVSGTFSPGNSPGLFTFDGGSTTLAGTTLLEVWGTARGTGYDAVNVIDSGLVTLGGTLVLDFNQNFSDTASFTLFDTLTGGLLAGGFTGITITGSNNDYTGLSFTQAGNVWTTSYNSNNQGLRLTQTASSVVLDMIAVPEPGTMALAAVGVAALVWAGRRRRSA
jgi:fibronectin-binding autotransporter adhesin